MYRHIIKRLIDFVLSFVGLILLAIPMLIFALIVKLDSPGPVLFWAEAGRHSKEDLYDAKIQNHVHQYSGQHANPSARRSPEVDHPFRRLVPSPVD